MSTVAEVMTLDPRTIQPQQTLAEACIALYEADCGGLPVVDAAGKLMGFVTDRDIAMCGTIQGRSPHELPVRAAMTGEPASVAPNASLQAAHSTLRTRHVRRLPVVDGEGVVVGVVSLADLVRDAQKDAKARSKASALRDTLNELSRSWNDINADAPKSAKSPKPAKKAAVGKSATKAKAASKAPAKKKAVAKQAALPKRQVKKATVKKATVKKTAAKKKPAARRGRSAGA